MARIRTIKPEFPHSESMGNVSRDARLTFVLLWTLADDSGRLRGNSRMLASLLFPYDDDAPKKIDSWLTELEAENCIRRYASEGASYVSVCNWLSHQKIDKPSASKLPEPKEDSRGFANVRDDSSEDQGPRTKEGIKDQGKDHSPKAASLYSEDFESWWTVYPRKEAKGAAWKAWPKAIASIQQAQDIANPVAFAWLIEITKRFAESPKGKGDFVPHPATFLNEKRFDDDPGQWQRTDSNQRGNARNGPTIGPGQKYDPNANYTPL